MKALKNNPHSILVALIAGAGLLGAGAASAQYAPEHGRPMYTQPHLIPASINVSIGWHGDRYWDGRRYWDHDEWMHRHPHDRDPRRDHGRDRGYRDEAHRY
jgi:hypothetical protein